MRIQRPSRQSNRRQGFTLIEMMIVVAIIGILATIAIPRFADAKTRANTSAARADLRNLLTAQESHFNDHAAYSGDLVTLGVVASGPVQISVVESTSTGWSAIATHPHGQCAIFYGSAAQLAPATISTVVSCS